MQESINLIPQEERVEQTKTKVVKLSTILSVIFLLFIGGVGGYLYYKVQTVKNDTELLDTEVGSLRSQIAGHSDIEINARNLSKKSSALRTIFDATVYYSKLVEEVEASTPSGIVIDSFSLGKDTTVALSGRADTYNTVQEFTNRLLSKDLFSEVALKSAGIDNRQDQKNFFIVVTYDLEKLSE